MKLFLGITLLACSFFSVAQESSLKILSYNIKHGKGMDGKFSVERIAEVIRAQHPDLVALQEVDKNCKRSKNTDTPAKLGRLLKMEHCFGKTINLGEGEYGVAILSRFPIKKSTVHKLPKGGEPRVALEAVVETKCGLLSLVTTHLDWTNKKVRTQQVKTIVEEMNKRTHPVILAGDFNAPRASDTMQLLVKAGWNVLKKNDGSSIRTFHGEKDREISATAEREEIDFIVLKDFEETEVKHGVIQELVASDHRPIYAEIRKGK